MYHGQGLGMGGLMGQQGYDPYEQARRQQQAVGGGGSGPVSKAVFDARIREAERALEAERAVEAERAEHNRKLLLLED